MTTMRFAIALALMPATVFADQYATDPALCGIDPQDVDGTSEMVMSATEMHGVETFCTWNDPITLDTSENEVMTTIGFCAGSDRTFPMVFTFATIAEVPGDIRMYRSSDEEGAPIVFRECETTDN